MADVGMPVINPIPTLLTNAKIYRSGANMVGVGDIQMPDFEYMTESIAGLGVGGELDVPVVGHLKAMTIKIKWHTVNDDSVSLLLPEAHHLDIRCNLQPYDPGAGKFINIPCKVMVMSLPKKSGIGKVEVGKKMEPETEMEISYLKMWINGQERVEVDKFNLIFAINGADRLADVRANLGG